jgi:uncharacterized membrane protein
VAGINASITGKQISFRWTFIVLPLALLIISIVLVAALYTRLPAQVAYHFQDSSPDRWVSRGAFLAWSIIPQLFLTLLSFLAVRLVLLSSRYWPVESLLMRRIVTVMGNMLALPQIILGLAMLDILLYNAYQIRLIPLWESAVIVMALGLVVLGVFFFRTIKQVRRQRAEIRQEQK